MKTKVVSTSTIIIQRLAMGVVGLAIILVIWIGYLLFQPVEVLHIEEPIPASPTEVQAGGVVNLNFDYCKYKDFGSYIKVDFLGEYVIPTLSTTRKLDVGCHSDTLSISIPAGTPNGNYKLRLEVDYQVNVLRRESYAFESVEIIVSNPDPAPEVEAGE